MVKRHNVKLTIDNNSGIEMTYYQDWFDSGRVADDYSWPEKIQNGDHATTLCYEKDWSAAGCSGYTQFKMGDAIVTIAFSNPEAGKNKLNIGTDGMTVWETMNSHNYEPFTVNLIVNNTAIICRCQCTGSIVNDATVSLKTLPQKDDTLQ